MKPRRLFDAAGEVRVAELMWIVAAFLILLFAGCATVPPPEEVADGYVSETTAGTAVVRASELLESLVDRSRYHRSLFLSLQLDRTFGESLVNRFGPVFDSSVLKRIDAVGAVQNDEGTIAALSGRFPRLLLGVALRRSGFERTGPGEWEQSSRNLRIRRIDSERLVVVYGLPETLDGVDGEGSGVDSVKPFRYMPAPEWAVFPEGVRAPYPIPLFSITESAGGTYLIPFEELHVELFSVSGGELDGEPYENPSMEFAVFAWLQTGDERLARSTLVLARLATLQMPLLQRAGGREPIIERDGSVILVGVAGLEREELEMLLEDIYETDRN